MAHCTTSDPDHNIFLPVIGREEEMLPSPKSRLLGGAPGRPPGRKLSWVSAGGGTPVAQCLWSAGCMVPMARTGINKQQQGWFVFLGGVGVGIVF